MKGRHVHHLLFLLLSLTINSALVLGNQHVAITSLSYFSDSTVHNPNSSSIPLYSLHSSAAQNCRQEHIKSLIVMSKQPKLGRVPSIRDRVEDTLSVHRNELISLLSRFFIVPFSSTPFFFYLIFLLCRDAFD